MDWIKINGCDFNVKVVATLSFDGFKEEFKSSFCIGKTDAVLEAVYKQLIAISKPVIEEDGNIAANKTELSKIKGKGNRISGTSDTGK